MNYLFYRKKKKFQSEKQTWRNKDVDPLIFFSTVCCQLASCILGFVQAVTEMAP
jgi:hypothetical protein